MDSCFNLENAVKRMKERDYKRLYWAVDLHGTIIEGKFSKWNEGREFYPDCKEVLNVLHNRPDMCLILWTSSQKDSTEDMLKWFKEHGIHFDYVNENPEMPVGHFCDFTRKFAFDILLDDKAGFLGHTDWTLIKNKLIELNLYG